MRSERDTGSGGAVRGVCARIGGVALVTITATVTATEPDYRGLAECLLDEITEALKDPEYRAEFERWKGGETNVPRTPERPLAG